ncbi:alpha/beta hydrolase [Mucilaginibacter agri]|uniref:Alpha/beta hydrolase n=1 Tax=Mucilaginibacter agri TaxID=2695265 RepID=A0A965ZIQ7_9SPHI|nr:alpha/beta hydrolase [Mucilaginibacter agri]NCD71820.1 hypothetical protein [Mucilaginibacter agri]
MAKIFLIAGLGADYRLFKNIELSGHDVIYVHWIEPEPEDTLATYAGKLIDQYDIQAGDAVVGVSLGGMITIEIAKQVKLSKAILISSIKTSDEAPWYFGFFKKVTLYKLIPNKSFAPLGVFIKPIFGQMAKDDELLFRSMLENSSPVFVKWAMNAVLNWKSKTVLPNVYQITGNRDLVFNYKKISNTAIVNGGTHIMVFDKAKEINGWLKEVLEK